MPRLDEEQSEHCDADIESAMFSGMWGRRAAIAIGKKYGITHQAIYLRRANLIAAMKAEADDEDLDSSWRDYLRRLRGAQMGAYQAGQFGNLKGLLRLEAEVMGYKDKDVVELRHTGPDGGPIQVQAAIQQFASLIPTLTPGQISALRELDIEAEPLVIEAPSSGNGNGSSSGGANGDGRKH